MLLINIIYRPTPSDIHAHPPTHTLTPVKSIEKSETHDEGMIAELFVCMFLFSLKLKLYMWIFQAGAHRWLKSNYTTDRCFRKKYGAVIIFKHYKSNLRLDVCEVSNPYVKCKKKNYECEKNDKSNRT